VSASRVLDTDRLGRILQYLSDTLVAGHPDLQMADLTEVIDLAGRLDAIRLPLVDRLSYSIAPVDARDGMAVDMLLGWAHQHAMNGYVEPPSFGVHADLLKLESRVKIATSWLWLSQRYPEVYEDVEAVVDLRQSLNAKIEERLVASSVARSKGKRPDEGEGRRKRRGDKRKERRPQRAARAQAR
jgi:ATP-dependent RNA helicase SUPV3L1/SUV3